VVFLLARAASDDDPGKVAGGPSTSTAPTTRASEVTTTVATTAGLAQQLRNAASTLDADDGPVALALASRLSGVADLVQAGGGAREATSALAAVAALSRAGQLPEGTATPIIQLLGQVPGIDLSVLDALTTPTTRADPDANAGKGKKDDNND